ncbi:MAG: hypothetical protein AB1295_04245 [Candidatus Micrarchaeota archaeon]
MDQYEEVKGYRFGLYLEYAKDKIENPMELIAVKKVAVAKLAGS